MWGNLVEIMICVRPVNVSTEYAGALMSIYAIIHVTKLKV